MGVAARPKRTEESVFARAQSILDAHARGTLKKLTPEEHATLREVVRRAKVANRRHPNTEVEISPYIAVLWKLEP